MCVALAALERTCTSPARTASARIPFAEFHRLPGDTPQIDNNLAPASSITAVDLPAEGFAANYTYLKLRDRLSYAFALVSVAAALKLDGEPISRRAPGARRRRAQALARSGGRGAAARQAGDAASFRRRPTRSLLRGAKGHAHNAFKIELARRAIVRALAQAADGTPQSQIDKRVAEEP